MTGRARQPGIADRDALARLLKEGAETLGVELSERQHQQLLDYVALLGKPIDREYNLADLLRRPGVSYDGVCGLRDGACSPDAPLIEGDDVLLAQVKEQIEIGIKYQGYIDRQADEIERNEAHESTRLPEGIDYAEVRGLSFEARQKLNQFRPETIGQASRISGITPAAISLLMVHIKKKGLGRRRQTPGAVDDTGADTTPVTQ